jgi:hypothetical protein
MRKAIYLTLLLPFLSLTAVAQKTMAEIGSIGIILPTIGDEATPPKLFPPTIVEGKEDTLLFQWEKITAPTEAVVLYEFILADDKEIVYSSKTEQLTLSYDVSFPLLAKGRTYMFIINSYITAGDRSY